MSPNSLKVLALALVAAASSLEANHVLPLGVSAGLGACLTFLAGLYHPKP